MRRSRIFRASRRQRRSPNIEALELDRLPDNLIVAWRRICRLELAQAYRRFGSRVSIVEVGLQLAGREDPDVADAVSGDAARRRHRGASWN